MSNPRYLVSQSWDVFRIAILRKENNAVLLVVLWISNETRFDATDILYYGTYNVALYYSLELNRSRRQMFQPYRAMTSVGER